MVHLRLNEREANPNKHINFISALPASGIPAPFSEEDARQLLRALAAQVRPIMKSHGFAVNSFEEYEYNRVFAGRNWNNGETIELVLRHADGTFVSIPWLLGTLCHELAHIKHMNHGRDFQKLWSQLRMEVRALQERGYFGDGYWSSGTRISDSFRIGGEGIEEYDLPEYVCGGAQTRSRPSSFTRRRRRTTRPGGPSRHTGAQTEKKRKPGSRVKAKGAFMGEGRALNDDVSDEDAKKKGVGFRKKAGSKRARQERALAAEKRLKSLKGVQPKEDKRPVDGEDEDSLTESDSEYDNFSAQPEQAETDEARRQALKSAVKEGDEGETLMRSQRFMRDFLLSSSRPSSSTPSSSGRTGTNTKETGEGDYSKVLEAIEISDSETEDDDEDAYNERTKGEKCSIPSTSDPVNPRSGSRLGSPDNDARQTKRIRVRSKSPRARGSPQSTRSSAKSAPSQSARRRRPEGILQEEMSIRKHEALGLTRGGGRKLASDSGPSSLSRDSQTNRDGTRDKDDKKSYKANEGDHGHGAERQQSWACLICTLENRPAHLACSACGTPRGESSWPHR